MIKFLATGPNTKRTILGIIISEQNVKKLKNDEPIHFNAEQMPGVSEIKCKEVIIMYYPTMRKAIEDMKKRGYISEDTNIKFGDDGEIEKKKTN